MSDPIIPWMGGKRRLADKLIPLFPAHECYVELFAGGAALYFLKPARVNTEVLNDINGELVNLYRVVQNHLEEFIRQFKWALSSRQIFEWEKMKRPETLTDIQRAARFYFLQQHAFGARLTSPTFGTATTGPSFNLMRIEESLSSAWQRMAGTYIENCNWEVCAERYDREHTFFYADPPYWKMAGYGVDFPYEEYLKMSEFMKTCKGKVMVSLNDHPDIREAFTGHYFEELQIKYSVGNQRINETKESQEVIITNYDPHVSVGLF